jgi:TRAP-type transport system periplasmic protein
MSDESMLARIAKYLIAKIRSGKMTVTHNWRNVRSAAAVSALALPSLIVGALYYTLSVREHAKGGADRNGGAAKSASNDRGLDVSGQIQSVSPMPEHPAKGDTRTQAQHEDTGPIQSGPGGIGPGSAGLSTGAALGKSSRAGRLQAAPSLASPIANPPIEGLAAMPITIRMGTLAPSGSSFHAALVKMGQKWRDSSGGSIKLIIYPDGHQGGEAAMVNKMRVHFLGAGMFTAVGLSEIDRSVGGFSFLPLMFRSWEEHDYVFQRLSSQLEKLLLNKGFVVLFWGDAGWVRFFSKTPALRPDDFKRLKIFAWEGDPQQAALMKSLGFNPVSTETTDALFGLQVDRINAIPLPPNQALLTQCYIHAKNMLDLKWSMLSGGAVIRKDIWDKIPSDIQAKLRDAAAATGAIIRDSCRKEDEASIAAALSRPLLAARRH